MRPYIHKVVSVQEQIMFFSGINNLDQQYFIDGLPNVMGEL